MNWYPQQEIYSASAYYWTTQVQGLISWVVGIAVMVAMAAWALSQVKKVIKGEEVKFPL